MLKIRALNRESSSDEDVPAIRREAQEEIALELYNKALRLQSEKQYEESKSILQQLLNENIPLLENNGGLPKSMQTLKYSCYINIGNICLKLNLVSEALETFLQASELDETDVTLWYKIGKLSLQENKFRQSAYAFTKGLECVESHWPCLDQLILILYAIKDTINCLVFIGKALILDPDYVKGLALRRQIYLDNPYAKEYYQCYNPDHVWEPSLDVEIDEEEAAVSLKEARALCERVTQVEKSFGPKPLETIPLPKPLGEFTWLAVAQTVIYIHKYITDNKMSYLTFIDMKKCMSQDAEVCPKEDLEMDQKEDNLIEDKPCEILPESEEKMLVDVTPERRLSQNGEGIVEDPDNTPVQTDNDEDQNAEQENDEQDENAENKQENRKPKGIKRKRDLLSDLQIWGWHSKRKQSKKAKEKDFTIEDAINRIIPNNLLLNKMEHSKPYTHSDDSMNTMDIYNMYMEEKKFSFLSPMHSPVTVNHEAYFGTDKEKDDVLQFWSKERECTNCIILIKEFVITLSKLWQYKWPKDMVPLYLEAYDMFREHYDPPELFCQGHPFEIIRDDALAMILYAELLIFSTDLKQPMQSTVLGYLQIVSGWEEDWKESYVTFSNRVYWLMSHIFQKQYSNELALRALGVIQENIEKEEINKKTSYILSLPNCFKCSLITKQIVENFLRHLDLINALTTVVNLYQNQQYRDVSEIIKKTFKLASRRHFQVGQLGRPAQIGLLLDSLWYINLSECFIWTEECLFEALGYFLKPSTEVMRWEKIVEKCLAIMYEIIKKEGVAVIDELSEEKMARLVESLTRIACKQINSDSVKIPLDCVTPWILIHYILVRNEYKQYISKRNQGKKDNPNNDKVEDELYPSVAILFSAHEFLGPKGWCLTGNGELLHFILDTVLDRLDTPVFDRLRDKIDIHIEQSLFCLYQHPSKKNKISRHLADHNVDPLPLNWERSFQLYEFYGPTSLPEFNSYKNASITSDLEQLFKRIIALVPENCSPQQHLQKTIDFIHGKTDKFPDGIDFPSKVRPIYYLIGDFYFKQREFTKCIKYFQIDLCINPLRLDSWACLALSYAAQLDSKLNHCEKFKTENEFLDKSKYASICFEKALELSPDPLVLWIEFGTFQYMVHSYCSRILKHESENFSIDKFEYMENQKNAYLDCSRRSFEKAITLYSKEENPEQDERWLQYYILGKIAEKKQQEPTEYLKHYMTASQLLDESNAQYPDKISYGNPQQLAVEALELHYRIHASILKYLELHEGKDISNALGDFFNKCINSSPILKKIQQKEKEVTTLNAAGFQQQFLDSILKPREDVNKIDNGTVNQNIVDVEMKEPESGAKTEVKPDEINLVQESECVILISDSDDEQNKPSQDSTKIENQNQNESSVNDVQKVLDEMMVRTMKETEQNELDSDLSSTEKCEEVNIKDDNKKPAEENKKKIGVEKEKPKEENENIRSSIEQSTTTTTSSSSSSSDSESDDDSSSSSSDSSSDDDNENMSNSEILALVDKCISGLEICIVRLNQNYKALYRLAHLYFNYKQKRDLIKCKQLFLTEYNCKDGTIVSGLFSDRKINNFFNGIYRIPSSEIDRPGSLSAHMSRCVNLLMNILTTTNDTKTLIDLCLILNKTPEPNKIYIRDLDRLASSEQALTMCTQCLRTQIKNISDMTNPQIVKLLQEIHRVYQRLEKHLSGKEGPFGSMLVEVYKKFIKEKIPDNVNVLELAIKFCIQHKVPERSKPPPVLPAATTITPSTVPSPLPRVPGTVNPPVLPSPSTILPPKALLKRPGSGRPRGRPPLPKIPGLVNQPKSRSNRTNLPKTYDVWSKQLLGQTSAYEYLKQQYQEELIKQYSKNFNMNQLTQISQLLTQGQMPYSNFVNQFLAQGYLNQAQSIKQSNPVSVSQTSGTTRITQPSNSTRVSPTSNTVRASQASSFTDALRQIGQKIEVESVASTSTSGGAKTLQEKLAEKKKEQLNKQLKGLETSIKPNISLPATITKAPSSTITSSSSKYPDISAFKVPQTTSNYTTTTTPFYLKPRPEPKQPKIQFPPSSSISIAQVPVKNPKQRPRITLPSSVSLTKVSEAKSSSIQLKNKINLPPDIRITKCQTKVLKPEEKTKPVEENVNNSSDDDVICIN